MEPPLLMVSASLVLAVGNRISLWHKESGKSLTFNKSFAHGREAWQRFGQDDASALHQREPMTAQDKPPFADLMRAVADRRDQQAFTIIFDYYAPRLKSWLMSQKMESSAAEELIQEVMMTVWRKAELYEPAKASLSTWLYRIARNRKIDNARRQKSRVVDENEEAFQPSSLAPPDRLVEDDDRERVVAQIMTGLPEEQINMLRLAFFQGLTHIEISETTGLPLGTVKSRLRLAFGKLRRALEESGIDASF